MFRELVLSQEMIIEWADDYVVELCFVLVARDDRFSEHV